VNALRIFNDSKTFVDRPLKFPPEVVVRLFEKRFPASEPEKLTNESLRHFVEENFDKEATELMTYDGYTKKCYLCFIEC
jgi:hypothetical protein